jgi:long-chain acyl-CoA synthetase
LDTLLQAGSSCPTLRCIVVFDPVPSGTSIPEGLSVLTLDQLRAKGRRRILSHVPPKPTDLSTICYTSGTTGNPKGAMLTHGNFAAASAAVNLNDVVLNTDDVHISYLPLAHVFERIVEATVLRAGASIGFFRGDVTLLLDDIAALRPTIFPSVPRLFNRIYDKVMMGVNSASIIRRTLFDLAFSSKLQYLRADGDTQHALWDRLVFSKLRALLGGRVRMIITGSAPLSANVKEFLQVAFCCPVYEGYGLTETVGTATMTPVQARHPGHVGAPAQCTEVKLVDLPEMKYTSEDKPFPRGEICLRGPNVFVGYYKQEAKTREALDEDGWFHTGDVGRINEDGTISIIDRKKNIFKLAQGEYIAPEKIENVYTRAALVAQAWVYGDSLQSALVGVIVPDPETVGPWASAQGIGDKSFEDVCKSKELRDAIMSELRSVSVAAGLKGFEQVRDITLDPVPFSVDNELLTPTFKLKRQQLKAFYATDIERMYASLK